MTNWIKNNWQNILIDLLLVGIFILGFVITYYSLKISRVFVKTQATNMPNATIDSSIKFNAPAKIDDQKGIFNTVLLGYGGEGHSGSYLTDSIIIVHIDTNSKKRH